MIIIKFRGGLGNQLFQYALYKNMEKKGKEVYGDLNFYRLEVDRHRNFQLPFLGLSVSEAAPADVDRLYGKETNIFDLISRKYGLKKSYFREKPYRIEKEIFSYENIYLDGYWQSELYFREISDQIKRDIKWEFYPENLKRIQEYETEICESESVSIHVRRGDYLNNTRMYGNICTLQYYRMAMEKIMGEKENIRFFVFSDDIAWAKENLSEKNVVFVEGGSEDDGYQDMYLMSLCKSNIIANSSFSWWAAYLNNNPQKTVITPEKWINGIDVEGIWCKDWIRIAI